MEALIYNGPENAGVQSVPSPSLEDGEVLVKPLYAGICGSDRLIFSGKHPRAKSGLILGHEFYGVVEKIQSYSENLKEGDRVVCYPLLSCGECVPCQTDKAYICKNLGLYGVDAAGGVSQSVKVKSWNLMKIPDELKDPIPALLEPLSVAVHAVRMSNFKIGDRAIVTGGGPIGILVGMYLKKNGAKRVTVTERDKFKLEIIRKLGLGAVDISEPNVIQNVLNVSGKDGADILFECSGSDAAAKEMTDMVGVSKQIVMVGLHKEPKKVDLLKMVFEELSIIGVRVYTKGDFREAMDFAVANQSELGEVITDVVELREAGGILGRSPENNVKIIVKCNDAGGTRDVS